MTVVDRLHVAADARNSATWSDVLQKGRNAEICWTIDVPGWKSELYSALQPISPPPQNP